MARISTYIKDSVVTGNDFVIGSDGDNLNRTSQFSVDALGAYITRDTNRSFSMEVEYGYNPPIYDENGDLIDNTDPNYTYYYGEFGIDDNGNGIIIRPTAPPVFRITHKLGTQNIIVSWVEPIEYNRPLGVWVASDDPDTVNTLDVNLMPTGEDALQSSVIQSFVIVDENTVDVDFGDFDTYRGTLIISGGN